MPVLLIGWLTLALAGTAQAASLSVNPSQAPAGATFAVSGSGFDPDTNVQIRWDGAGTGAPARTDAAGAFTTTRTVPIDATPGSHTVSAQSSGQGPSASSSFTVTSGATTTTSTSTTTSSTTSTSQPPTTTSRPPTTTQPPTTTVPPPTTTPPGSTTTLAPTTTVTPTSVAPPTSVPDTPTTGAPPTTPAGETTSPGVAAADATVPGLPNDLAAAQRGGGSLEVSGDLVPGSFLRAVASGLGGGLGELDLLLDTRLIAAGLAPDAAGGLIANAPIPDDLEPGEYTLRLVDPAGPTVVAERVIVIGQQAALPSALLPLAAIVGLLFLLIVALVRGARKRQTVAGGSGNALAASAPIAALPAPAAMNVEAAAAPVAAITTEAYIEPEIAPVAFAAAGRGPWSRRAFTTEPNEQVVLRDVATWAGRVWAAGAVIGEHGSHMALWASDDGVMWGEPQLLSPGSAVRILADGSDLYVVGEGARAEHGEPLVSLWHSQDAETWLDLARSVGTRPTGLVTDAVISAALPIIACRTAEASEVWTRFDAGWMRSSFPGTVSALGQIGERLVGLGTYRASAEPMAIELLADGVWHEATIEAPPEFDSFVATDMVTFHGQLVAVGSSATGDAPGVWVSHDGARWRPGTPPPAEGSALRGAAVVAGQLIVFGGNSTWFGPVLRQSATVWSSSDVHEWESLAEGAMFDDSLAIAGAAAGDRLYLAGDIGGDSATTSHTHTAAVWIREFAPRSAVGLDARVSSLGRPTIGKPL